ncbi:MAG: hypothetical protein JXR96_07105 [Deltaproteobacteria bacterium]|nr:hypothetical protein [Deltaproteobacteria bacterium]
MRYSIFSMALCALALGGCDIFLSDVGGEMRVCEQPGDCAEGFKCVEIKEGRRCLPQETAEHGQPCFEGELCINGLECFDYTPKNERCCRYPQEGEPGHVCFDGWCREPYICSGDSEPNTCVDPLGFPCQKDEDCGAGQHCVALTGRDFPICIPDDHGKLGMHCYDQDYVCQLGLHCIRPSEDLAICAGDSDGLPGGHCVHFDNADHCDAHLRCEQGTCVSNGDMDAPCAGKDDTETCNSGLHCVVFDALGAICVPGDRGLIGQTCHHSQYCEQGGQCIKYGPGDEYVCAEGELGQPGKACFRGYCTDPQICVMGQCRDRNGVYCTSDEHCDPGDVCIFDDLSEGGGSCSTNPTDHFGSACSESGCSHAVYDTCVQFDKARCTKVCSSHDECTNLLPGARCILVEDLSIHMEVATPPPRYCGLADWTRGYGVLCEDETGCRPGMDCLPFDFPFEEVKACTTPCKPLTCPDKLECCTSSTLADICALGQWCGHGWVCAEETDCPAYDKYQVCSQETCGD